MSAAASPATLRVAAFPHAGVLTEIALVVGGAALVALAAQIAIGLPFTPVPVTGQTLAVGLVGASLGAWRGLASLALYLAAGVVGLHVYADGAYGWDVLTGPTGGYLFGFLLAALLTGWLAEHGWSKRFSSSLSAMLSGNVLIYLTGTIWLAYKLDIGLEETLELGLYPFVPGDILKLYIAGALLPGAWWVVRKARGQS